MRCQIIILIFLLFPIEKPNLNGKWKLYRSETFENILTSNKFQTDDPETQQKLAETFSKIIDGYFYDFKKDTVVFTDYKNFEIVELKGIWWSEEDTLIIGRLGTMSVQKYLISRLDESELHLKLINPRDGLPSKSRLMFKRED